MHCTRDTNEEGCIMFQRLRTVSSPTLTYRAEGGGVLAARGHGGREGRLRTM